MPCSYCGARLTILPPLRSDTQAHKKAQRSNRATKDHVWPLSRFQQFWDNRGTYSVVTSLIDACQKCNSDKSDDTLREWITRLPLADPRYARIVALAANHPIVPPHHRWKNRPTHEFW